MPTTPAYLAIVLSLFSGLAHAQDLQNTATIAAQALYVSGVVKVDGTPLGKGDTVAVGAKIETASDGHVYLKAIDGGFLVVRAGSKAVIQSYDITNETDVRIKIELISGTARSITGTAAQADKDGFRFNTPVAAIGVRGTDFTVRTTETETLVSVASGGVAVSPLTGVCLASGFGPCQGDFLAELTAADKGFLRVVKALKVPELIQDPDNAPNAPMSVEGAKAKESPELSPVYEETLLAGNLGQMGQNNSNPQPIENSSITWGRWQQVAQSEPNSIEFQEAASRSHYGLRLLGPYFLASQVDRQYTRPVESQVTFSAVGFDAVLGQANGPLMPAMVSGASLSVNFDERAFNTRFTVANEVGAMNISAQGSVGALGNLEGGVIGSNAKVVGFLEGNGSTHATTLFNAFGGAPFNASGVVEWSR